MFCPHPFRRVEIKPDGNAYVCCVNWLPKPIGNVLHDDLLKMWRGSAAREIRESILDRSFRHCIKCPFLPGPGGPLIPNPPATLWPEDRIGTLKIDYDQTCNLACPSCRPAISNGDPGSQSLTNLDKSHQIHEAVLSSKALLQADELYVTGGGDPFASPLYWNFLQHLPDLRHNDNLRIFLHTNGILFNPAHWEQMGPTRERVTGVGISIDAACERTYQLNRGASWSKLWKNIEFITSLQKTRQTTKRAPIELILYFTMQTNNYREVPEFTTLGFDHKANWIAFTPLQNWGTYSPEEYLQRAIHLPSHPLHEQFLNMLLDPRLRDHRVIMASK